MIEDLGEGGSKKGRQLSGLVATRRLEPPRGIWRHYAQQAVQLSINIQDLVIIMAADQEDPRSVRRLECDNDS
jgi:hypothetical protein